MDLKQLKFFVQVAELASFSKAAGVLEIGQSTLSRQVRALEVGLGVSLLHRNGRGVLLTPEGQRFLNHARGVLHAADAAVQVLHEGDRRLSGRLVFGLTPSVGRVLIPELVRRFRQELPGASLSVVNLLSIPLHEHLRAGRLDFAIAHRQPQATDVAQLSLRVEPLHLIGPRGDDDRDAVPLRELDGLPLAMRSMLHVVRRALELEAARNSISLNVVLEVDVLESLFEMVAEGAGHTVATRYPLMRTGVGAGLVMQRIVEPNLSTELCLVSATQRVMTPLQQAAVQIATAVFADVTGRVPVGADVR